MRSTRFERRHRARQTRTLIVLGLTMLGAGTVAGCGDDDVAGPVPIEDGASLHRMGSKTIIVRNSAELVAALSAANAGRRIRVRAGTYSIDAPLTVTDGVTLEGEGVMRFSKDGLPLGFAVGTRTTLKMSTNVPGDMLTLGDRVSIRGLEIVDMPGRAGNVVAVLSRDAGDRISATISETEIVNPNPTGIGPEGPIGYGLVVLTRNPNLGDAPAPHARATLAARMTRSVIQSPAGGSGVFAFNFAPLGQVSVTLAGNVVGGAVVASGGVSRPDAVHDSRVSIKTHGNLYHKESADPCASPDFGLNLRGGSGPPVPLTVSETARNRLSVHSIDDRIEGFTTGILATGGRRAFGLPIAGPTTNNSIELMLVGTQIRTPSCGGATFVRDLVLEGASTADDALFPGDGNTLRVIMHRVTGSGFRFNQYAHVAGPSGPLPPALPGSRNRLEIVGSPKSFARTNRRIDPPPSAEHFKSSVH